MTGTISAPGWLTRALHASVNGGSGGGTRLAAVLAGTVAAAVIARAAWRLRTLDAGGATAAIVCGAAAAWAGPRWALLLVLYFVGAAGVSAFGSRTKRRRTAGVVAKGGARDAAQVLANGGVFIAAAAATALWSWPGWAWAAVGALAASSADTWATEFGTLYGHTPRSVRTGRLVRTGESGGVSLAGNCGAVAGALFVALAAYLCGWPRGAALAGIASGVVGAFGDSLLGATVQARRWCAVCGTLTEQDPHDCGTTTRLASGLAFVTNDVVNALATLLGAGMGIGIYYLVGHGPGG